ncbi:hypothetical protein ABCS02_31205 [Microbacterium sp. X-17]|uniref:hypothetical protein n=1 Tax=Microbacterium sp. X-17 TaxID=3144404 RepID=UPI0031F58BDE
MSEWAPSRLRSLPVLALAGASIALAVAVAAFVRSWVDGGEAGLSDVMIGAIPMTIVAIPSTAIAIVALAKHEHPRWMAVTAVVISGVLASLGGLVLSLTLLLQIELSMMAELPR